MAGRLSSNPASSRPGASPQPHRVNTQTKTLDTRAGRILCLADIRGRISNLNQLAQEAGATAIIHTGDFGFFENSSLDRINDRTLRHLILYSPLVTTEQRNQLLADGNSPSALRSSISSSSIPLLSEFPKLLAGDIKLNIPVYTVWGACEDVTVLEKFRSGEYDVENLHVLDEATTRCIDVGGVKLRLLGLGGALVPHKMFDNGEGQATIAGGSGTMWTTALQIGELVDTAQRTYDQSETRLLVSHASPGREGLMAQLALVLKADLTISAGLHFRYASSYNEFSVQSSMEGFRLKLASGKESFDKVWDNVKQQVEAVIDENQRILLEKALTVIERVPAPPAAPSGAVGSTAGEEPAWKNCWNWNLCDAAYGHLVLDIRDGRISSELKSQGFNYAYRRAAASNTNPPAPAPVVSGVPASLPPNAPVAQNNAATQSKPSSTSATPHPQINKPDNAPSPHPHINGTSSGSAAPGSPSPVVGGLASDKPTKKKLNKKEKEREREEKQKLAGGEQSAPDRTDTNTPSVVAAAAKPLPRSNAPSPAPQDGGPLSPMNGTDRDSSAGGRTPITRRPPRNPWTLYVSRLPVPVSESELRDYFGEAQAGITSIKLPLHHFNRQQKPIAFVEFGDEEAMKEGLAKHADKLKDVVIAVSIAEDRQPEGSDYRQNGGFVPRGGLAGRGTRGGRGGIRGGGVLAAAQAAAGPGGIRGGRRGGSFSQGSPEGPESNGNGTKGGPKKEGGDMKA